MVSADAGKVKLIARPLRVSPEVNEALEQVSKDMAGASKSEVDRYIIQIGLETWQARQVELFRLNRLAENGLSLQSILPYLGARAETAAGGWEKKK